MFTRRWLQIVLSIAAVLILLLSSSNIPNFQSPSNGVKPASTGTTPPAVPFLPYLIDPSQFPQPDILLNGTGNITHPHLSVVSYLNQSIYQLIYTYTDVNGNSSVMYLDGRYDPGIATCIFLPANCTGKSIPHSPINWSAPKSILWMGRTLVQDEALGSSGGLTVAAVASNNKTQVLTDGSFGENQNWTSITPTAITGASPQVVVSPCTVLLTTRTSSSVTATTFDMPCGLPQTPPLSGGSGEHQNGPPPPSPPPFVTSVVPNVGQVGTPVTINGGNFAAGATVAFGSTAAWTVQYVSPVQLTAVAPPGSGTIDVRVTVGGLTSGIVSGDRFTYTGGPPPPAVEYVTPSTALPNAVVNITGANFAAGAQVVFGGIPARSTTYRSSTLVSAVVPWDVGLVDVQVLVAGVLSTVNPGDHFLFAVTAATLPSASSASPVLLANPTVPSGIVEGVLTTDTATSTVKFYNSTNHGLSYTSSPVGVYSLVAGSALFSQLGTTETFLNGGIPGQTAALTIGSLVFALYTTQLENRTVVETAASSNGGRTWTGPYPSAPLVGTVAYPVLAAAPDGYVYATWLENGAGPWQLDQAIYAESGRLLYGPTPIPGSGGAVGSSAVSPSVAIDGLARPLYIWESTNTSNGLTQLRSTGAFPSANSALSDLNAAFDHGQPWDFTVQGSLLSTFESSVNTSIASVQSAVTAGKTCTAQSRTIKSLAPLLSTILPKSVYYGVPGGCGIVVPASATKVVNATGPASADTYLAVYSDWLAESTGYGKLREPWWPGAPGNPDANLSLTPSTYSSPWYAPDQAQNASSSSYYVGINPITVNPNTLWLNVTGWATSEWSFGRAACNPPTNSRFITTSRSDSVVAMTTTVKINGGGGGLTYVLHGMWPSAYVTNLTAATGGTWSVTVQVTYKETKSLVNQCAGTMTNSTVSPIDSGWPQGFTVTLQGNFTTYEETVPGGLVVHEVGNKTFGGSAYDYAAWNNSILSASNTTVKGGPFNQYWNVPTYQTLENTGQFAIPLGGTYNAWANLTSEPGGTNQSWPNQLNTNLNGGTASAAETGGSSCSFTEVANPIKITWKTSNYIQNVTTSSATLTWYSNISGRGWASYNDSSDGVYTQTALEILNDPNHPTGYPYRYEVQLHGLSPWGLYRVTVGVSTYNGCLEFDNGVPWYIQVLSLVQLQEMEYPYDSVTEEGGGARVTWSIPSQFAAGARFDNGTFTYCEWVSNACAVNTTAVVPLQSLSTLAGGSEFVYYWVNDTFQVNLTGLILNASYNASVVLNYTLLGQPFVAGSDPFVWTYAKDTSGDGLTDWEKVRGWEITEQTAPGTFRSYTATANPMKYATNGLTSDFLEKEYGLDPNRISTTGDGMLDTWNLTFDLGSGSPALPTTGFVYWSENSSYHFNKACADPALSPPCSFSPLYTDINNLTDNGPGSAEILWNGVGSTSALSTLEILVATENGGSPLRAVTGNFKIGTVTHRTITVWGKLSWGADPLAWSTPEATVGSGVPGDGSRVNPLSLTDLNVTLTSWSMDGLANRDGVSTFIHATSNATQFLPTGQTDYSGYSLSSTSPGSGDSWYGPAFPLNFQVAPNEQNVTLNFSMVANTSGHGFTRQNPAPFYVDLENTSIHTVRFSGALYTLNLTYQVVPVFSKAPTILLVPGDNSTLSNLPLGLKRYTGEQNFVLLEVNDTLAGTNSRSVGSIPYVNASAVHGISTATYTLTLSGGMNNILVPRTLFKNSLLGEALLNMTFLNVTAEGYQGHLESTFAPGLWVARVTGTSYGGTSYAYPSAGYIKAFSNTNQNCTTNASRCGGVSGNSAVEAQVPAYAVEAIFTLNITNLTGFEDLLAGLLLNTSGNFTSWGFAATAYLPTLSLSAEVTSALASPWLFNEGAYGAPKYTQPSAPPSPWQVLGSTVWNAVSGVVGALSAAWGWVAAAGSYMAYLAAKVASWGLGALSQVASVLKSVAGAIVWAIDQLLTLIASAVDALLRPISQLIANAMSSYLAAVWTDLHSIWSAYNSSQNPTSAESLKMLSDLFGVPFTIALVVGGIVAVAMVVVQALSVGAGFLVDQLVEVAGGSLVSALVGGLASLIPTSFLTSSSIDAAWWMYNQTGGGVHIMLLSTSCATLLGALATWFGIAITAVQLKGDYTSGEDSLLLLKYASDGYPLETKILWIPIVTWALDAVSIAIAVAGLAITGLMGKDLNMIGLALGAIGLLVGFYLLVGPSAEQLKDYDMYSDVLVGEGFGVAGTTANLIEAASGC